MAGGARIVVYFLGNSEQLHADMDDNVVRAKLMGDAMSRSATESSLKATGAFEESSHKIGKMIEGLGNSMNNMGVPFGNVFVKMGTQLEAVDSKAKTLGTTLVDIGKVSLFAGGAAGIAAAVVGLKLYSDQEKQTVALQTAIENSGHSWAGFQDQLDKTNESMQKAGHTVAETEQALAAFTTSTGSPTKALHYLGIANDYAAEKNVSLQQATQDLMPVLAGSARAVSQLGLNLPTTSGRMESLIQATQAYHKAQLALQTTTNQINDGFLTGSAGVGAYKSAQLNLADATEHLHMVQNSIAINMDTIAKKVQGASTALGKTLPGQVEAARATIENFGATLGKDLDSKLKDVEKAVAEVIPWIEKNKQVIEELAYAIGSVLGLAMVVFVTKTTVSFLVAMGKLAIAPFQFLTNIGNASRAAKVAGANIAESTVPATKAFEVEGKAAQGASAAIVEGAQPVKVALGEETVAAIQTRNAIAELITEASGLVIEQEAVTTAVDGTTVALETEAAEAPIAAEAMNVASASMLGPIGAVALAVGAIGLAWVKARKDEEAALSASHAGVESATSDLLKYAQQIQGNPIIGKSGLPTPNFANASKGQQALDAAGYQAQLKDIKTLQEELRHGAGYQTEVYHRVHMTPAQYAAQGKELEDSPHGAHQLPFQDSYIVTKTLEENAAGKSLEAQIKEWENVVKDESRKFGTALTEYGKHLVDIYGVHGSVLGQRWVPDDVVKDKNSNSYHVEGTNKPIKETMTTKQPPTVQPPGITVPNAPNPLVEAALSMIASMQQAMSAGTIASLEVATSSVMKEKMDLLISQLNSSHKSALMQLANELEGTWKNQLATLGFLLANQQKIALADQTQAVATGITDLVTILSGESAEAVKAITDASQIAQDRANSVAQIITDQGQTMADKLGERGLYGLNLMAQEMKVSLDQMTTNYDKTIGADQVRLDMAQRSLDRATAPLQNALNNITKQQDQLVARAQEQVDLSQGESALQQKIAETALKTAEANAAIVEARAQLALVRAEDAGNAAVAQAQAVLAQAQANAKTGEAKQQELISIEEARANTEFAGSGVHIQITGINPTDAAAVASAVSWHLRTKVPA